MKEKNINILLFLSEYKKLASENNPKGAKCENYCFKEEKYFKGTQTNDAPVRYLIDQAKSNKGRIKRVLCITTNEVDKKPDGNSQYKRFEAFVKEVISNYDMADTPDFVKIPYDFDGVSNEKKDYDDRLPEVIYRKLSECFKEIEVGEEVYIDYTGGLRDISFLMTSIIRFLEFKGLKCGEIVYSNYFNKKLYDIHYIYDLYQLINGVNEFVNTGNARELVKVYEHVSEISPAGRLVDSLKAFSDALSICDTSALEDKVKSIVNEINELENYGDSDIFSEMLKTLAPVIREKMYLQEGFNCPKIIRWCAENNMIQQAATIYVEQMPKYYFDNQMVPDYVDKTILSPKSWRGIDEEGFYTELFNRAAEGAEVKIFLNYLNKVKKDFKKVFENPKERSRIIDCISSEQSAHIGEPVINSAFDGLKEFIVTCYEQDGLTRKADSTYSIYKNIKFQSNDQKCEEVIKEDGNIPNNFKEFWDELTTNKNKNFYWLHRFLYNDQEDYSTILKLREKSERYSQKAYAIQKIKAGKSSVGDICDPDITYRIMAYYLAVKIIRNRINHATENDRTEDEKAAIETLNSLGIDINFRDDIDSYKNILLNGIAVCDSVRKKVGKEM